MDPHTEKHRQTASAVVGRAKGQPEGVKRSKIRVGSRKLAGGPQRNTERQLVSSVLRWAR